MIDPAITDHYQTGYEQSRLFPGGQPALEFVRSLELAGRLLPAPPARVLDVGGGPGAYAAALARRGYQVTLVDPVPLHVAQARAAAADPAAPFAVAAGDARDLPAADESADAVLMFGPLYHLTEAADRQRALAEARRVLLPGGLLLAMAISRFASLFDGLYSGWLDDPRFARIVARDLADGQHRNADPVGRPEHFTTAYFHHPDELAAEAGQAGFAGVTVYGVEGPGWPLAKGGPERSAGRWAQPRWREQILAVAREAETERSLAGFSPHLIAAATRP
jgi:ubiquinone/menaquinone biosynthesis C-methylase UbiE